MLPEGFTAAMADWLGPEWPALRDALEGAPVRGLRLQRLAADGVAQGGSAALAAARPPLPLPPDLAARLGPPVPWLPGPGRYLPGASPAGHHVLHETGAYYIQEPSAMAAAAALSPRPGERVLDLCAAPGGKATALAALLRGTGLLAANDPDPRRAATLLRNLERVGAGALVTAEDPERLAARWAGRFDAVLVDAPCSGEGLFRREPGAAAQWSPAGVEGCARRQRAIVASAAALLRPGGRLLYSTCTLNPVENERVVAWALSTLPLEAGALPHWPGWEPGRAEWAGAGGGAVAGAARRLWPHRAAGEGAFLAALRAGGGPAPGARAAAPGPRPPAGFRAWLAELLPGAELAPGWEAPVRHGEALCAPAAPDLPLDGLRVLRPGLALARAAGARLEPHHHLAMALAPGVAARARGLDPESARAYLAGEALPPGAGRGAAWVHLHGLPLGWVREAGTRANNLYPRGLRRTELVTGW